MRIRYDMSHVDLGKVSPDDADLTHLPDWLEPQIRETLRRMDYANKATKADPPVNMAGHFDVDYPCPKGEEWKVDIGGGQIISEVE